MNETTQAATRNLDDIDDLLRNMGTTMQLVGLGLENMANGGEMYEMMNHFRNTIQDARALLDDARGAVVRMQLTA